MSLMTVSPVVEVPAVVTESTQALPSYEGIPLKLMDYFGMTFRDLDTDTKMKLTDTWEHFKGDKDPFLSMAEMENKIGKGGYERVIDKLWRYSKLQNQIKSLEQQREALYAIRSK
jgi:hypothetical protein